MVGTLPLPLSPAPAPVEAPLFTRPVSQALVNSAFSIVVSPSGLAAWKSVTYAEACCSVIGPPFELGLPSIGIPDDGLWQVINRYRERYETVGLFENTLYDGVVEMLDALADAGLSLSIALTLAV